MDGPSNCLFITYVEKEGPFLKVWGQTDKNTSLYIEQVLHSFTNQFDNGLCIPLPEILQIGILCCAKYKDNKYYRARITSLDFLHNRYIEVNFVDYGHKDVVPISNIRSLEGFETSFISIQPQAASFLLAEAVCPRGEWNDAYLDEICKEIRYSEVNFSIIAQVTKHYLVRLFVGVNDLAIILISKGLMRHTSLTTQEAVLLSMMPRTGLQQQQPAMQQNFATYKAFTLEPGSQYEVYVSYVTDGPCNFSVQLKQSEEVLGKLMKEINSMTLTPIEGIPIPGTVCLARCMEDGHICRAVVTNEVDGQFKVFYVDFGNFEQIPLEALYEIPFKYVIPKVMAIRFALAGVEKSTVTLEMQCAFKQFVDNRLIHMKVMPMTARTSLPRCELWDPESHISALDIVHQAAAAGYPDHISLNRGFNQPVKVSYVFSCNRFYVQLKSKQDDLLRLMLDIQVLCREADSVNNNMVKVGTPCYALYEGDQQWYRSQIVEVLGAGQVKVQYVDYGNEEVVSISLLKPIEGKQLTILRPQAIECCLNGYQKIEPDLERDNLLEELILEQEFTMKVVEMQEKKALIELTDAANYNVSSLLLEKIAVTKSQVSPMLVQAGKIEHRKSSQPYNSREQPFKPEHQKPDRGQRNWAEPSNDSSGWRQDGRGSRNRNSYESNESNENNSWRQNNKGFDKNYDRNKRDSDVNDSTDSERQSSKGYSKNDRNRNDLNEKNSEGGWKQNNRGFNKNQDRYNNRDSNRNNDWANTDERKSSRENDMGSNRDNDKPSFNSRENDDWGGAKENDTKSFNKRDNDNWGGAKENDTRSFNKRDKDDWGGAKENDTGSFNKRDKDNWGSGRDTGRPNYNSRNKDDWNSGKENDTRYSSKRENWGNKDNDNKNFNSREGDSWGGSGNKRDNWGNNDDRQGRDNFRKPRNRSDEGADEWNNTESTHKGGFKKKEFKRETSELSSDGSEKSFRKGFKDNFHNKNKPNFQKKFDRSPKSPMGDDLGGGDSWGVGTSTAVEVPNPAPSTAKFTLLNVVNTESNVTISWFHNPGYFYCQIDSTQDQFKRMMEEIQEAYKGRPSSTAVVGAPIIGLFPEDSVLYRAEVLETIGSQFKVYYVDFGNVSVINKVWPIEVRFMELPAQAICCKLSEIEPPGETWPEASSYSPYFDKKQFLCRFISTDSDKTAVKLECDNEDIGSLLLRDGLAISLVPAAPPELPLLIGQQFRAMLISINSLADFSVSLQSGIVLNCGIFNLSESTETWEDTLKEKLEQILIVYVDDLKDDKLEVTLYDQSGVKIKLIDKDEEAYESVELLCPYLIMYSSLSGEITHVEENSVFIQPSDCAQTIEYLLNTSFQYYENTPNENPVTPVEGYVYAVKGSDTNWYRGRVTAVTDNQATVTYLDYGNAEQVDFAALRELSLEFMEVPITCLTVSVKDATEDLIGKFVIVNLTFTEAGLEGTIQEEEIPALPPEQVEAAVVETQANEVVETQVNEVVQPALCGTLVILSHTDSPSDFYLQLGESIETIDQLQATLQEQIPEMADMENPVVGVLCAAPYSLDQQWYRAQVLDADADITTVRFVDYGNTDVLDNNATRVKTLPPNLLSLEVHATRCRLKIKPVDEEWPSAAIERFEQLCGSEALTAQFISQDEKTNYVELYANGTNVRDVLIQENLALPDEVLVQTSSVGFVSHLNSPSEFWIQLENCVDELEWVAEQLSGSESFSELEDLAPGTLCAALFPDDQMWYRARILSNTVAGIEVLFVDYGNSCTSCSLRELPEDLVMLPPLAQKCSLQKPENLTNWGPEMVRKFSEISADGQTTFNVQKLSTGETASVELLLDGVDVITLLLPQTEEVRVKSFVGLDEMVLIKGDEELPSKYKLESLPDVTWSEESFKKFEEINSEGKTVFQAEFVSDDTVRLYLGLNDIRLDLNGVKSTTPTSSPLKSRSQRAEGDITLSDTTGDTINDEIKNMVEGFVESVINHHDNTAFVGGLIGGVVDNIVTNQAESTSSSDSHTDVTNQDETVCSIVTSILTDIIEQSTNQGNTDSITHDSLVQNNQAEASSEEGITESSVVGETQHYCDSDFAQTIVGYMLEQCITQVETLGEDLTSESQAVDTRQQDFIAESIICTNEIEVADIRQQDDDHAENSNIPFVIESSVHNSDDIDEPIGNAASSEDNVETLHTITSSSEVSEGAEGHQVENGSEQPGSYAIADSDADKALKESEQPESYVLEDTKQSSDTDKVPVESESRTIEDIKPNSDDNKVLKENEHPESCTLEDIKQSSDDDKVLAESEHPESCKSEDIVQTSDVDKVLEESEHPESRTIEDIKPSSDADEVLKESEHPESRTVTDIKPSSDGDKVLKESAHPESCAIEDIKQLSDEECKQPDSCTTEDIKQSRDEDKVLTEGEQPESCVIEDIKQSSEEDKVLKDSDSEDREENKQEIASTVSDSIITENTKKTQDEIVEQISDGDKALKDCDSGDKDITMTVSDPNPKTEELSENTKEICETEGKSVSENGSGSSPNKLSQVTTDLTAVNTSSSEIETVPDSKNAEKVNTDTSDFNQGCGVKPDSPQSRDK